MSDADDSVNAILQNALSLHQSGQIAESLPLYLKVLEVAPDHPDVLFLAGTASLQLGDPSAAVERLEKSLSINPGHTDAWNNLGLSLMDLGRVEEAIGAYRKAIENDPVHIEACGNLGLALSKQNLPEEAEAAFRRAIDLNPGYGKGYFRLGNFLASQGREDEALENLTQASLLAPDHHDTAFNLGLLLLKKNEVNLAEVALRRALDLKPDNYEAGLKLCECLTIKGNHEESADRAAKILCEHSNDPELSFSCANFLVHNRFATGALDQACDAVRAAADSGFDTTYTEFFRSYLSADRETSLSAEEETRITDRLEKAQREWDDKETDLPPMAEQYQSALSGASEKTTGKKVLIVSWEYNYCDPECRKNDLTIDFDLTASADGLTYRMHYCDSISYPEFQQNPDWQVDIDAFISTIEGYAPDIILVDGNYFGSEQTINVALLGRIKAQFNSKIGVFFADLFGDRYKLAQYWAPNVDMIITFEPCFDAARHLPPDMALACVPVPIAKKHFNTSPIKDIDIALIGSISGKYLRADAASLLHQAGIPLYMGGNEQKITAPDYAEYAQLVGRTKIMINFTARNSEYFGICARLWETIFSGGLFLEQDCSSTRAFFIPFVHYIPFTTMAELVAYARYFLKYPSARDRIARQGLEFAQHHYSDRVFWDMIIKRI